MLTTQEAVSILEKHKECLGSNNDANKCNPNEVNEAIDLAVSELKRNLRSDRDPLHYILTKLGKSKIDFNCKIYHEEEDDFYYVLIEDKDLYNNKEFLDFETEITSDFTTKEFVGFGIMFIYPQFSCEVKGKHVGGIGEFDGNK